MKSIYFIDIKCKRPYDFSTLRKSALGGTESTMLRVAERLQREYTIVIVQPCREHDETGVEGMRYLSMRSARALAKVEPPTHVIVMRKIKALKDIAVWFPSAKLHLWIQDLPMIKYRRYRQYFIYYNVTLVCNSNWQRGEAERYLDADCWYQQLLHPFSRRQPIDIITIYNAINPDITYQDSQVDKNKLVFFSAPRKGLKEVLQWFAEVIRLRPQTRLYIANPGYQKMPDEWVNHPNLINLGSLGNMEVIQHVREAFCVFYPQRVLPETFGVVYAESNTVGTPVLCYDIGAASEILSDSQQIMSTHDEQVVEKLMHWYESGRPVVRGKPDYLLDNVVAKWKSALSERSPVPELA